MRGVCARWINALGAPSETCHKYMTLQFYADKRYWDLNDKEETEEYHSIIAELETLRQNLTVEDLAYMDEPLHV